MRKLTYLVATTVDGFIAAPDGGDPSGPDGFFDVPADYIEHVVTHLPEILPTHVHQPLGVKTTGDTFDTVVMGRRTFEPGVEAGVPNAYAHLHTVVYSTTMVDRPEPGIDVVCTDPVEHVRQLKSQPGKGIWLCGGGVLAGVLYDEIDELVIKLNPVSVRSGTPMFVGDFQPQKLILTDHLVLPSGTAFLTYRKA